MELVI